MTVSKLNQNGQISLPATIRKEWKLKPGDFVQMEKDSLGRLILTPVDIIQRVNREEWIQKTEETGVNVGALLENLEMTPTERLKRLRKRLERVEKFKEGKFKIK